MQNKALGACFTSIWGQVSWGDTRALRSVRLFTVASENPSQRERLSINMLKGLMSVIAHHSMLRTSRTRWDCSLALQTEWEHSYTHAAEPPHHLCSFCPSWTWPFGPPVPHAPLQLFLGFHSKNVPNTKQKQMESGGDALAQPSFIISPFLYWHSWRVAAGHKWGSTGREMWLPSGRKGDKLGGDEQQIAPVALSWKTAPAPEEQLLKLKKPGKSNRGKEVELFSWQSEKELVSLPTQSSLSFWSTDHNTTL